jgi:hypothetical protein
MDLYFLNFKRILVVLSSKDMRENILKEIEEKQIDVNIKFADSYFMAAGLIKETPFDPYDHIVLNLSFSNTKLKDFLEFISESIEKDPQFVIAYTPGGLSEASHE